MERATRWLCIAWAVVLAALGALLVGAAVAGTSERPASGALVWSLGLSRLAIEPSGRPPRTPAPPSVPLRHGPRVLPLEGR